MNYNSSKVQTNCMSLRYYKQQKRKFYMYSNIKTFMLEPLYSRKLRVCLAQKFQQCFINNCWLLLLFIPAIFILYTQYSTTGIMIFTTLYSRREEEKQNMQRDTAVLGTGHSFFRCVTKPWISNEMAFYNNCKKFAVYWEYYGRKR